MCSCAVAFEEEHTQAIALETTALRATALGVHWWRTDAVTAQDHTLLSAHERQCAARMRVPGAAGRYVAAHAGLRRHLASYLGVRASELRFCVAEGGKPYLPDAPHLHFNLSHSGAWALLVCSTEHAVGVDVEALVEPQRLSPALLHQSLCPRERAQLHALPEAQRSAHFTRWWTAKEAVMKLCGLGLQLPPTAIEVMARGEAVWQATVASPWQQTLGRDTPLRALHAPAGYVATLAVPAL